MALGTDERARIRSGRQCAVQPCHALGEPGAVPVRRQRRGQPQRPFGLVVAVPSMIFYRYYRAKVDALLVDMELQAIKLVEIIHGERQA